MTLRFLVTGIGRSGTGYAAKLLTNAKQPCGHEVGFGPKTTSAAAALQRLDSLRLVGESSWYAAPFIRDLPSDVVILHQVRHPRSWIGSWCAPRAPTTMEFLRQRVGPYQHTPEQAARLWLAYNLAIEQQSVGRSYYVYRPKDAPAALAEALGIPRHVMRHADGATPKNVNHRKRSSVTLRDVPDGLVLDLKHAWAQYGQTW